MLTRQCLTYTLIINYAFNPPKDFSDAIPLLLLGGVIGLPAVLILLTTRKVIYLSWMLVYLIALPVWCVGVLSNPALTICRNFILPVYAFWHFGPSYTPSPSLTPHRRLLLGRDAQGRGRDEGRGARR